MESSPLPSHAAIPVVLPRSIEQENAPTPSFEASISDWCGRGITLIETAVETVLMKIVQFTQQFFALTDALTKSSVDLAAFFRKLDKHVLRMFEEIGNIPGYFKKFVGALHNAVGLIDCVQVAVDIDYFAKAKFLKDSYLKIAGTCSIAITDLTGAMLWFEEMSFYNLSAAAASIGEARVFNFLPSLVNSIPVLRDYAGLRSFAAAAGELRIFSWVPKISLNFVCVRTLTLGYAFLAADAFQRLIQPGDFVHKTQASLDLASYISELALDALLTIGVANVIGLGAMGLTCLVLALASFLWRITHNNNDKKAQLI